MKKMMKMGMGTLCMTAACGILLTGCGSGQTPAASSDGGGRQNEDSALEQSPNKASDEENYEIVMAYVTAGTEPTDLRKVEAKLSELTKEKIHCTVKFKPVAINDLRAQYNLWASSGEPVDLLMMFNMNLGTFVDEGKIISMEDYKEYAPNIMALSEESPFLSGGYYDNQLYAIPIINPSTGQGKALYARKDLVEATGIEQKDMYSYEDLDQIFAKIHEQNPELVTIGWTGVRQNTYGTYFIDCDTLGVPEAYAGVLMDVGSGSTEVVNFFETEAYKEFLQWMHQWQQDGYFSKDASTTSDIASDWVKAGRCAGFTIGDDTPGNIENQTTVTGYETVQLNIKETYVTTETYNQLRWCISTSSKHPEKAMQFLDMLYDGEEVVNLIMNGIEGEHYIKHDGSKIISYPDGINGTNTPYNNTLGIYGDKRNLYMFEPNEDSFYERSEAYTANALKHKSVALGYSFISNSCTNEIAAISSVLSKYLTSLEYGMVNDLDATYNEFIQALKDAGIDKVIEENQRQLDEWLAKQDAQKQE